MGNCRPRTTMSNILPKGASNWDIPLASYTTNFPVPNQLSEGITAITIKRWTLVRCNKSWNSEKLKRLSDFILLCTYAYEVRQLKWVQPILLFLFLKLAIAWSRCGGVSNWEVNDGISIEKRRLCKENGQILVQPSYKHTGLLNLGLDDQSFFSDIIWNMWTSPILPRDLEM